eukprot:3231578-Amphidinium_carterae.1
MKSASTCTFSTAAKLPDPSCFRVMKSSRVLTRLYNDTRDFIMLLEQEDEENITSDASLKAIYGREQLSRQVLQGVEATAPVAFAHKIVFRTCRHSRLSEMPSAPSPALLRIVVQHHGVAFKP